jgi:hypothetical protein
MLQLLTVFFSTFYACFPSSLSKLESSHAGPYYARMPEGFELFARSQSATHLKRLDSLSLFLQYLAPPKASFPLSQAEENVL